MTNGDAVQFTVKELLGKLGTQLEDMDEKLDRITARLELKAEKAELEGMRATVEQIRLVQAQAAPIDTRAMVDRHLQEPHSVAQKHEERISSLEKWKYSIPPAILAALTSVVIALLNRGG